MTAAAPRPATPDAPAPDVLAAAQPARLDGLGGARAQAGIIAIAALLALAAIYASIVMLERQEAIRKVSRYNLSFTASQAAIEVSRLQAAVGAYAISRGEAERDAVELWLDLIINRVAVLRRGEAGAFVRSSQELAAIVDQLAAGAESARDMVDRLDDPDRIVQLMRSLQRLNPGMARLLSMSHGHGAAESARDAAELDKLYWRFSYLLMGLIVCCGALAALAVRRNHMLASANAEVRVLVDDLTRTGRNLAAANERARAAMEALTAQNATLQARDAALRRQNELFDAALNNMSQGLGMFDRAHRLIVCNRQFGELLRLTAATILPGMPASEIMEEAIETGGCDRAILTTIFAEHRRLAAQGRGATFVREEPDGRSLSVSHRPLTDGGWLATYEDVTEGRRAEARIRHLANHDVLTGLPNRRQFAEKLADALVTTEVRADGTAPANPTAVLLVDLDHFKKVNDTLGHQVGDALLRSAAERIRRCVRGEDLLARLGGDEFAILLRGEMTRPQRLEAIARRIADTLSEPFLLDRFTASVGASIGVAVAAEPGLDADAVMRHADVALYRAKSGGRGTFRMFEASMAAELQARMDLENDLRAALEGEQFTVFYQPLFDLRRGRLSGFEALLRWRHPVRGMVSPAEFIPVAEETGLIVPIGAWALRRACEDTAALPIPVKVGVNISAVQFAGDDLPALVRGALAATGLAPNRLELEITESVLLQESDGVLSTLHRLRDLGVGIALDDFGTKYSSLSYLRSFPFDKIKIDQSFVRDMAARDDCQAIVQSVAHLAARLGMTATAEGVEDASDLEQVRMAGCTEAQGYFFGRPSPVTALSCWLEQRPAALVVNA